MKHIEILVLMSKVPKKMVALHNTNEDDGIYNFILYDIFNQKSLNIPTAAYLIDNPDFNRLQGIAGIDFNEINTVNGDVWADPKTYKNTLQSSSFNKAVKEINEPSVNGKNDTLLEKIAHNLHIQHPEYVVWDMKHNNHGILIFDNTQQCSTEIKESLHDCMHFLCFCPIH